MCKSLKGFGNKKKPWRLTHSSYDFEGCGDTGSTTARNVVRVPAHAVSPLHYCKCFMLPRPRCRPCEPRSALLPRHVWANCSSSWDLTNAPSSRQVRRDWEGLRTDDSGGNELEWSEQAHAERAVLGRKEKAELLLVSGACSCAHRSSTALMSLCACFTPP